jgi:hypothetical protein
VADRHSNELNNPKTAKAADVVETFTRRVGAGSAGLNAHRHSTAPSSRPRAANGACAIELEFLALGVDYNVDPSWRFSTVVTLGKKPGSTDPGDSFAGWLRDVSVLVG